MNHTYAAQIARDVAACADELHNGTRAADRLILLLSRADFELAKLLAETVIREVPPHSPPDDFDRLDLIGARLAIAAVICYLADRRSDAYLRRLNRSLAYVHVIFRQHDTLLHCRLVDTWFDQLRAYLLAYIAGRDLMGAERPTPALLSCLAERIVVAASYQIKHFERLAAYIEHVAAPNRYTRMKSILTQAVGEGLQNSWFPSLGLEELREGADQFVEQIIPHCAPQRLTTVLGEVRIRRFIDTSDVAETAFHSGLNANKHFTRAGMLMPHLL